MDSDDLRAYVDDEIDRDVDSTDAILEWVEERPEDYPGPSVRSSTREESRWVSIPVVSEDPRVVAWTCRFDPHRARRTTQAIAVAFDLHHETEGRVCDRCVLVDGQGRPVPEPWPCATVTALLQIFDESD